MLVTAGCSFVWGDELKGWNDSPPTHWEYTFTHLLAKKLGIEYSNRGVCGACNDKIFREVTDFLHSHPHKDEVTHVVVMWSAWQRKEVVEYMPEEREVKIGRQNDVTQFSQLRTEIIYDKEWRRAYKYMFDEAYDSKTDIMHTLSKMKALEVICEAKGIILVQGVFHKRNWSNIISILSDKCPDDASGKIQNKEQRIESIPDYKEWLTQSITNLKKTSRIGMGHGEDMYSIGISLNNIKEHGHPGERTQKVFANQLHEIIAKISQ
jgi:hypothetical protein